jgi:hypothetical protein
MSPITRSLVLASMFLFALGMLAQTNSPNNPTWWNKYQYLSTHPAGGNAAAGNSGSAGANVDVSNECGPQSETYITLDNSSPKNLAGGSNEIFRLPMRAYSSFDNGKSWTGVDAPLPPARNSTNDTRFGSDPSLVFDTRGNLFYSYIVVFFGGGNGVNGTEMAVAKSTDGGKTFPANGATYFNFATGGDHFNDKPMITADANSGSPFRDNVYVAWDAASGGSSAGGIRVARSSDHGANFTLLPRADNTSGPSKSIGSVPFVGPNGELFVAWNDYAANTITVNRSFDAGNSWGTPVVVANKTLAFDIAIPSISFRGALEYPTCDADRSGGAHNGRLYCSWMDLTSTGTDIFTSYSDDGTTWSARQSVTDPLGFSVDRFYPWLSVDQTNGSVNVSFYDTRNDITGARYMTDVYLTQSNDGGKSWRQPNTRVSSVSSNEHDCDGVFPCSAINYGNQYGDYTGLVSYGGLSHPIWTDSRKNETPAPGCATPGLMEEVFTATVK